MGWATGFEPATSGATVRRSTTELRPPYCDDANNRVWQIRTTGRHRFTKLPVYQISVRPGVRWSRAGGATAAAALVAVSASAVTDIPHAPVDLAGLLARVGERVEAYYARAQSIICLETVHLQPMDFNFASGVHTRRLVYELRVSRERRHRRRFGAGGQCPAPPANGERASAEAERGTWLSRSEARSRSIRCRFCCRTISTTTSSRTRAAAARMDARR